MFFAACTFTKTTIHFMPTFKPNEYLLKTHSDKGSEDWEIFAWAVRQAIAKQGDFPLDERPTRDFIAYRDFV